MSSSNKQVVLVTGANQGIGFNIVEQLAKAQPNTTVLLGCRNLDKGKEAVKQLDASSASHVVPLLIDIDDEKSIEKAAAEVKEKYGSLSVLCNNAGVAAKGDAFDAGVFDSTFRTNYYGLIHVMKHFLPLVQDNGKIINVSSAASVSALGKLSPELRQKFLDDKLTEQGLTKLLEDFRAAIVAGDWTQKGYPTTCYGMSKVGVSILSRIHAKQTQRGITVNYGCPGWCKTSMAGDKAPRSAAQGAETFVTIITTPNDKLPNGEFWEDNKVSDLLRGIPKQ